MGMDYLLDPLFRVTSCYVMPCHVMVSRAMLASPEPCRATKIDVVPCHYCFMSCRVKILTCWDHLQFVAQDVGPTETD